MHPELRLYEDVLPNGGEAALPALPRMIFVVHGSLAVADRTLNDGEAWSGEGAVMLKAGSAGATVWRWELVAGDGGGGTGDMARTSLRAKNFQRSLRPCPRARCCCAATASRSRRAAAPICTGIRGPASAACSKAASASTPTATRHSYGPGGAWYETGPDGVFAQAADRPTRFIRVMVLPLAYLGKSSVEYLNEEDKAKPKAQQYKIFADMPLTGLDHLSRTGAARSDAPLIRDSREIECVKIRSAGFSRQRNLRWANAIMAALGRAVALRGSLRSHLRVTEITSACSRAPCRHRSASLCRPSAPCRSGRWRPSRSRRAGLRCRASGPGRRNRSPDR